MVSIYTDGSSGAKGGRPGGWAWVIVRDDKEVIAADCGGSANTTNNIMELTAAIKGMLAIEHLKKDKRIEDHEVIELVSDSQYALGIASGGYMPVKNLELAQQAREVAAFTGVRLRWVRGHSGNVWNERVDSLAEKGKFANTPAKDIAKYHAKRARRAAK